MWLKMCRTVEYKEKEEERSGGEEKKHVGGKIRNTNDRNWNGRERKEKKERKERSVEGL